MITQTIMGWLFSLFQAVSSWMSTHLPSPPTFWTDAAAALTNVTSTASPTVLYFLPIGPALGIGASITALVVALGLVKLVRRAVSLFTGGGGSAG